MHVDLISRDVWTVVSPKGIPYYLNTLLTGSDVIFIL